MKKKFLAAILSVCLTGAGLLGGCQAPDASGSFADASSAVSGVSADSGKDGSGDASQDDSASGISKDGSSGQNGQNSGQEKDEDAEYADLHYRRVSVHDPSVIKADGTYYIFGSHRAWAKSDDLISWDNIANNLNAEYKTMFTDLWENYCKTDTNPDIQGNMWAPDIIYNDTMGKYCMYMSINGDDWNSAIVLLTADEITGPYTYIGPVVFSGFNTSNHPAEYTDVYQVLGEGADLTRYQSTKDTKINAIDPCVKYDEEGNLWMAFGSWFGGIYMLKLDPATGLRDYSVTYETAADSSDAYYGYKIAGGHEVSGEGPYIIHTNGYYYLFLSYGGLTASGGYQMRVFRSEQITGPYTDQNGNPAIFTKSANNLFEKNGIRLMSSYSWSGSPDIYAAQGHNSALVDDDGRIFLVYHTRFSNRDEQHQVRTHQLFVNEDGWLVAAPYEYAGESLPENGYAKDKVCGEYEFITHLQTAYFQSTDMGNVGVVKAKTISLNEDGTVTGEDNISGSWSYSEDSPKMSITIDGVTYQGYFVEMPNEGSHKIVMTFTALGDNVCVWGSKI